MSTLTIQSTASLNNGVEMPRLGLGTWQVDDGPEVESAVRAAIELGYRHIDTAAAYGNEAGVGRAVRDAGIPREQIFVTTKLPNPDQRQGRQRQAFDRSMQRLDLDYIDLYLIHWPVRDRFIESWKIMEELLARGDGKVRAIGVGNFLIHHLESLMEATEIVPAVDQVEFHPRLVQPKLMAFCRQHGIQHEAWSPIMQGRCDEVETLVEIGKVHGKSATQVALRWDLQKDTVTIPKSTHRQRLAQNAELFDFALTDEQVRAIDALDRNERIGPDPDRFTF